MANDKETSEELVIEAQIEKLDICMRCEELAEAMHSYADGFSNVQGDLTYSLGVREMMFLFINRLRNIARGQPLSTPRLECYLDSKSNECEVNK